MGVAVIGCHDVVGDAFVVSRELRELTADEALRGVNGVFCVGDSLTLGRLADETLAIFCECDHRWGGACAL